MKKRYARILAATLSAAMVFTSAPASVFDTGVIEAQAATDKSGVDAAFDADLAAKVQEAINTTRIEFDGSKKSGGVKTAIENEVKTLLGDKVSDISITFNTATGNETDAGDYALKNVTATLTADAIAGGNDAGDTVTVDVSSKKATIYKHTIANVNDDAVKFPADITLRKGTAAGASLGETANGYVLTTAGATALKNATGTTVSVEIEKAFNYDGTGVTDKKLNSNNYDFTALGNMYVRGAAAKNDKVVRTVTVKVADKAVDATPNTGDLKFNAGSLPTGATIEWGGVNPSITNGTGWTIKASELTRVSTLDAATPNVKVMLESEVHDAAGIDWAAYNTDVDYNVATQRYEKEVSLTIAPRVINEIDLVWPDALAAGETVAIGDDLTKKKLVETESKKFGTFEIAGQYDGTVTNKTLDGAVATTAKKGTNKIAVKFTPNATNCTLTGGSIRSVDKIHDGASYWTKIKVFNIDIDKTVIADDKVEIKALDTYDPYTIEYGKTIGDVMKSTQFTFAGRSIGSYALKTGTTVADVLPLGKSTITYTFTLTDTENYELSNGKTSKEVSVDVNVVDPVVKASALAGGKTFFSAKKDAVSPAISAVVTGYNSDGKADNTNATLGSSTTAGVLKDAVDYSYQWYITENGATTALRGATKDTYTPSTSVVGTAKYYCVITTKVKDTATDAQKAVLAKVLAPAYTSEPCTFTIGEFAVTMPNLTGGAKLTYGYAQGSATATVDEAGYTIKTAKWSYIDSDKASHDIATSTINGTKKASIATLPTGLAAGKYTLVCEITAEKDGKENTCPFYAELDVDKAGLADAKWNTVSIEKVKVTYGTKLSDIKIKPVDGGDAYGTYVWTDPDYTLPAGTYNAVQLAAVADVVFVPSKDTKNNYYKVATPTKFTNDEYATTFVAADITVEKATLTVKPADVTVAVKGKVELSDVQTVATGLVGNDTLGSLRMKVSYKLADTIDTSKAGTIADAIITSAVVTKDGTNQTVGTTTKKTLLDNYNIELANGSVIVKATTTTPVVKPTPAPVKQATAAAPKASKAKVSVKAGKKYTLKLKYAAGKKSTVKKVKWTSSKKSVATVSSKGKVTAKKAGKATIYARVYFKDGSMKKVKFTVTVK